MPGRFAKSFAFTIAKLDEDKRQVFGWASVVTKNGQPVVDRQGDVIPVETLEEAAYCSNTTSPPLVTTLSLRPATASRVGVIQTGYLEAATPGRPQQSRRRRSANRHWTSSSMDENVELWRNREFESARSCGSRPDRLLARHTTPGPKGRIPAHQEPDTLGDLACAINFSRSPSSPGRAGAHPLTHLGGPRRLAVRICSHTTPSNASPQLTAQSLPPQPSSRLLGIY